MPGIHEPAPAARASEEWDSRVAGVERLTRLFKVERLVHLFVTCTSLLMLLAAAAKVILAAQGSPDFVALGALFGSSGLITYSASRLLRMWDQALAALTGGEASAGGGKP